MTAPQPNHDIYAEMDEPDSASKLRGVLHLSIVMDPPPQGPPDPAIFDPERTPAMAEPATSAGAGILLAKLLPAGAGALLMVLVDPPENKRELFTRLFVGLVMSMMFTGTTIDGLHSLSWFSFLDRHSVEHVCAIAGLWGALGWFVIGGMSMWARKFKGDPSGAIADAKKAAAP